MKEDGGELAKMNRQRAAEPKGGGASMHHEKPKRGKVSGLGGLVFGSPRNSTVARNSKW